MKYLCTVNGRSCYNEMKTLSIEFYKLSSNLIKTWKKFNAQKICHHHKLVSVSVSLGACSEWSINFRLVNVHAYSIIREKKAHFKQQASSFARSLPPFDSTEYSFWMIKIHFSLWEEHGTTTRLDQNHWNWFQWSFNFKCTLLEFMTLVPHLLNHSRCFSQVIPIKNKNSRKRTKMLM